jgi:hypothetical protein
VKSPDLNSNQPRVFHIQKDGSQIPIMPGQLPAVFTQGAGDFRETPNGTKSSNARPSSVSSDPALASTSPTERSGENDAYEDLMKFRGKDQERMMSEALRKNRAFGRVPHSKDGPVLSLSSNDWNNFEDSFQQGIEDGLEFSSTDNDSKTSELRNTLPDEPPEKELSRSQPQPRDGVISSDSAGFSKMSSVINGKQPQVFHVQPDGTQIPIMPGQLPAVFAKGAGDFRETPKSMESSNMVASSVSSDPAPATTASTERSGENDAYEDLMKFRGKDHERMMSEALRKNRAFGRVPHSMDGPVLSLSLDDWNCFEAAYNEGLEESRLYNASLDNIARQQ